MSRTPVGDRVRLFGIRHHGPGSARSLLAALDEWQPQILLIEGPSEAEALISHVLDRDTVMPVAMLVYVPEAPHRSAFYPLAEFSPELQALRWAASRLVPVRMMDLPATAMLGLDIVSSQRSDALDDLAEAAGFEDGEDWWEHLVEQRADPYQLFVGIESLMCALRESSVETISEAEGGDDDGRRRITESEFETIREANMRRVIRQALAEGHERVAVVCGAWHVPALKSLPLARKDDALLKGLPKLKVGATVVPWTFDRLTFASGYGAGARSPAFYDLLWNTPPTEVPCRWLLSVAHLMRDEDLDASPASVIEAVRLADALAALRGRPRPGLRELSESAGSVLIRDGAIWNLIGRRLIVGERMGAVPDSVPMVPLQADLRSLQKRLRMKVDDTDRKVELDLRGEMDLERSHLLHRLAILGVDWGVPEQVWGKKGTFHEHWRVQWAPELTIAVIQASIFGNTVESAASERATQMAKVAGALSEIAELIERVLVADLQSAVEPAVAKLQELSATSRDFAELADALPPLAAVVRYGTVRRTESERVVRVLDAIFSRLCVGLPSACLSLDDEAASAMADRLGKVNGVVRVFDQREKTEEWVRALESVAALRGCHRLVVGKGERLRFDMGVVDGDHLALRLGQEASTGAASLETAAFVEGLLDGPGAILLHQESLFRAIDQWITGLDEVILEEILPLIRRTFSLFTKPERRQIGERVAGGRSLDEGVAEWDEERARRVLPVIREILGLPHE